MRTKLLTMFTVLLALFSTSLKAQETTYYWYVGNDEEIAFGDIYKLADNVMSNSETIEENIDWTKAQQVTSFESLGYSSTGTKITMERSGENHILILCPKSWSDKWQFWNVDNTIDLTTGFTEVEEILETTFVKDGIEYDLWMAEGYAGNIAHIRATAETKYYWYAGTTDPTTMTSIDPIIPADAASYVYGWTEITEVPTMIKVFKESSNWQETGLFPEVQWYMACPSEYEFNTTYNGIQVGGWYVTRNAVSIGDVEYDVWKCMALTDAVYTQLAKVGDPVSNPEPTPEPEGLSTSKYYRVKNVTTGLYLQVEGNNTNMKLQNKAEGLAMMQIFGLEDAEEGKYYIKAADADNRYYAHASGWNFNATTNADNKTPFTIAMVEGEEGVYTLHQSVSAYTGLAGADGSEAGSPIYCNKGVGNNGKWAFEALTAEEQAAYVATLTAAVKPALEAAIAHAEGVVSTRSAVLSADDVAAINAAVATAKAEKDNTADVDVLYALADAINAAVSEAIYVWNLDELSNAVCYAVSTEDRGAWYSQSENLTGTTKAGVAADATDSKQQFAFVKSANTGAYYLYSVSEEKFIKVDGQYTALTEAPVQTISILNGTRSAKFPWVVALNAEDGQKQMGISNGYDPAIITFYNDLGDGGNTVRIEKVAAFDATAALAAIEALETGVEKSEIRNEKSEMIFDLTGRRVEKMEKGIYIVNGRKVIVK